MDARPDFLAVDRDGDAAPKGEVPVREAGEQRHAGERREDGLERSVTVARGIETQRALAE